MSKFFEDEEDDVPDLHFPDDFVAEEPCGVITVKPRAKKSIDRIIFALLLIALFLSTAWLSLRMFVLERYEVNQFSMSPTIQAGELIWANKLKAAKRYDVISFKSEDYYKKAGITPAAKKSDGSPKYDPLLKRIVGVAGDTLSVYRDGDGNTWVRISREDGWEVLLINEDYGGGQLPSLSYWSKPEDWDKVVTVPEDYVFVLGDMRGKTASLNESVDSRMFGPVAVKDIIAVVCGYNKNLSG